MWMMVDVEQVVPRRCAEVLEGRVGNEILGCTLVLHHANERKRGHRNSNVVKHRREAVKEKNERRMSERGETGTIPFSVVASLTQPVRTSPSWYVAFTVNS